MFQNVAEGVYRIGRARHNFYVVTEGGRATVIDAGGARELPLLIAGLARLSLSLADVEGILLTHSHTDHIGFAAELSGRGIPVRAHHDEVPAVRDRSLARQVTLADLPLWKPSVWWFLIEMGRAGARRGHPVSSVQPITDDEVLDLPGRPRVVHTPGHTVGHAAYLLEARGALFSGDALATRSFLRGGVGPQMLEDRFHHDPAAARASLDRLARFDADLLLPGHGDPWSGPIADLVARARHG